MFFPDAATKHQCCASWELNKLKICDICDVLGSRYLHGQPQHVSGENRFHMERWYVLSGSLLSMLPNRLEVMTSPLLPHRRPPGCSSIVLHHFKVGTSPAILTCSENYLHYHLGTDSGYTDNLYTRVYGHIYTQTLNPISLSTGPYMYLCVHYLLSSGVGTTVCSLCVHVCDTLCKA